MQANVSTVEVSQIWVIPDSGPFTVTMINAYHQKGRTLMRNHHGQTIAITERELLETASLIYDPALPALNLAA